VRRIKDREPTHAERGLAMGFRSDVIGTAMHHPCVHAIDRDKPHVGRLVTADIAGYATHGVVVKAGFAPSLPQRKATSVWEAVGVTMCKNSD
jgi:hypothetical protein